MAEEEWDPVTTGNWELRSLVGAMAPPVRAEMLEAISRDVDGILAAYRTRLLRIYERAVLHHEDIEEELGQAHRETLAALLSPSPADRRLLSGVTEGPRQ